MDRAGDKTAAPVENIQQIIQQELLTVGVAIIARVDTFDPATQEIYATPMIRRRVRSSEGALSVEDRPQQIKIPLATPYVRMLGFSLTMPISPGDQVMLIIQDRGIDLWQETGEISDPPETDETRAHNYTDAIYILAPIDLATPIEDYRIDSAELRNRTRSTALTIWDNEAQVRATPTNKTTWTITGNVETFAPVSIKEDALVNVEHTAGVNIINTAGGNITETATTGAFTETAALGHTINAGLNVVENALTSIEMDAGTFVTMAAGSTIDIEAGSTLTIDSDTTVVINAPSTIINSDVTINGDLIVTGTITAAGFSGPASAAANFGNGLTTTDATINGISHKNHKHTETGTTTSTPIAGP